MISFDDNSIQKVVDKISKNLPALELQGSSMFIFYHHV